MMKMKFLVETRSQGGIVAVGLCSSRARSNRFLSSPKRSHWRWSPDFIQWVQGVFPRVKRLRNEGAH